MLMHSLLVASPILIAVLILVHTLDQVALGGVLAWGHLRHFPGDFDNEVS